MDEETDLALKGTVWPGVGETGEPVCSRAINRVREQKIRSTAQGMGREGFG